MMIAIIMSGEEERLDIDRRSERKPLEEGWLFFQWLLFSSWRLCLFYINDLEMEERKHK